MRDEFSVYGRFKSALLARALDLPHVWMGP